MKRLLIFIILFFIPSICSAQVISPAPKASVFVTGAYIAWASSTSGSSHVDYGTTTSYGSTQSSGTDTAIQGTAYYHAYTLTGLDANTLYHYKVTTGSTESSDYTFTTLANPTGTVMTVKSSGGDYTSLDVCMDAASAGWTCLVYNGATTGAISPGVSGSAGNYITAMAYDAVSIISFNVSGKNYLAVKGFNITSFAGTGSGSGGDVGSAADYIAIENNFFNGGTIYSNDQLSSDYWSIKDNSIFNTSIGLVVSGENVLIDNNDICKVNVDCIYDGALRNSVIRKNVCHDYGPASRGSDNGEHVDFFQWDGNNDNSTVIFGYDLFEDNTAIRCVDSGGDCHFLINRGPQSAPQNMILRGNFASTFGGGGITFGTAENIFSNRIYNNTFAFGEKSSQSFYSSYYANYTKSLNNIAYESETNGGGPWDTGTGIVNNYNVAYNIGYSGTWDARYSEEATYSTYRNQNPAFTNYPYSAVIPSDSWMVDKGGNLTTVTSGCGTATLTLADVRWFQPGWAGTNADVLKIGATVAGAVEATISSISYSSTASTASGNVVFTGTVSCTNGDKVWLYKNSSGTVVLAGTAPDVGAYETGVDNEEEEPPSAQGCTISGGVFK